MWLLGVSLLPGQVRHMLKSASYERAFLIAERHIPLGQRSYNPSLGEHERDGGVKDPRHGPRSLGRLAAFDDDDAPLYSMGQAADALGTRPAALRRLDAAGVISPGRSSGGQRRYSRRQIERAGRVQAYVGEGASAALAGHVVDLEDEVDALREELRQIRQGACDPASAAARLPRQRSGSD